MSATGSSTSSGLLRRSTNLSPDETDLWELCHYAGVTIDPLIFRVLVDLLNMDVHPKAVMDVLKDIVPHSKYVSEDVVEISGSELKKSTSKPTTSKNSKSSAGTRKTSQVGKSINREPRNSSSMRSTSTDRQTSSSKASKSRSSSALAATKPSTERAKSNISLKQ